jgi:RNA polymerase sigma-70 factor (ECF subfamily)
MSDLELVRSAVKGDDAAFHALVDRLAPSLFRSAQTLSRNRADAEDLLQETFIAAYRGLKSFAGRSSVRTWLLRIMTRQAFKALHRTRHFRSTLSLDSLDSAPGRSGRASEMYGAMTTSGPATSVERKLDVLHVLRSMTIQHREVLMLREIQGLSYEEIAQTLGVPRGTVESRLFRARAEFRQRFETDGDR